MKIILTVLASLLLAAQVFAQDVTIHRDCLTLGDLFPQVTAEIKLTCGFMPGDERMIPKESLNNAFRRMRLNVLVEEDVTVFRNGMRITEEMVRLEAEEQLKQKYPDYQLQVDKISLKENIFSDTDEPFLITFDSEGFGATYATVRAGGASHRVYLYVRAMKEGFVTADRVGRDERLQGKVERELVDVTNLRGKLVDDVRALVAVRSIAKGRPVTEDVVKASPDMFKGDQVRLIYVSGALRVEALAELEDDAFIGKVVPVMNLTSGKTIMARYTGDGCVEASF